MKWLANSGTTKKISLPTYGLASQLWKNLFKKYETQLQEFQQQKEDRFYSPPVQTSISAINSKHSFAQERGYRVHAKVFKILWVYLWDYRKDMKKWDGKSTSTLEAWACELQGKTITNVDSSGKIAAPVSSRQFPRHSGMANLTSDSMVNSVVEF